MIYAMSVFALVAVSPHNDPQKRGFTPCSDKIMNSISACSGKYLCSFKAVIDGNICYAGVVNKGLFNFMTARQPTPWANYLFAVEKKIEDTLFYPNDDELEDLLQEEPDLLELNQKDSSVLNSLPQDNAQESNLLPNGEDLPELALPSLDEIEQTETTNNRPKDTKNDKQ